MRNNPVNLVDQTGHYSGDESDRGDPTDSGFSNLGVDCQTDPSGSPTPDGQGPGGGPLGNEGFSPQERAVDEINTLNEALRELAGLLAEEVPGLAPTMGQVYERTLYGSIPAAKEREVALDPITVTATPLSPAVSPASDPLGPGGSSGALGPGMGPGVGPGITSPPIHSPALAPREDPFGRHMRERLMPLRALPEVLHYVEYPALITLATIGILTFGVVAPAALGVVSIGYMFSAPTVATAVTLGYAGVVSLAGAVAVGYAAAQVGLSAMRR